MDKMLHMTGYRWRSAGLVILLSILFSCIKEDKPDSDIISYVKEGDAVPVFTVSDGVGGSFSSEDFIGKRTLLVLFHTGCEDCQRELPKVNNVWQQVQNEPNIQVITIARQEERTSIEKYWGEKNFTLPFFLDPDRAIFSLFASSTIPRLYIIDANGLITWMAIETLGKTTEMQLLELVRG